MISSKRLTKNLTRGALCLALGLCFYTTQVYAYSLLNSHASQATFFGLNSGDRSDLSLFEATELEFGFDYTSYMGTVDSETSIAYSSLNLSGRAAKRGSILETAIQGEGFFTTNDTAFSFFEVSEAYFGTSRNLSPAQAHIGRKLVTWNHLDEEWGLGIWQPRFRWDYLHPSISGLSGLHGSYESESFRMAAFASPLFIPERGASHSVNDGEFETASPWVLSPSSRMELFGQKTPVVYTLDMPPVTDLVINYGASVMARVGEMKGPWASAGYAYKPINQILIGYEGNFSHPKEQVEVTLHPRVAYHHLYSAETGFIGENMRIWASVLHENPERDTTPATWTTQEIGATTSASARADYDLYGTGTRATTVHLSYLKTWATVVPDLGPLSNGSATFDSRYPFTQALALGFRSPLPGFLGEKFYFASRFTRDLTYDGSILSGELEFNTSHHWRMGVGIDLLGSDRDISGVPAGAPLDFISRYRANDRFHGGVTYVF